MVTLALLTNQPILAAGLRAFVYEAGDASLVASAESIDELAAVYAEHQPAVVVVDLAPGSSIEVVREASRRCPRAAILLLSRTVTPELSYQAREFGASSALPTDVSPGELLNVVRRIAGGEFVFSRANGGEDQSLRKFHLSPREGQLVVLLSQGLRNKEIATVLGITEGTVKVYLSKLFQKVGAKDRFELALFGLKNYGQGTLGFALEPVGEEARPTAPNQVRSLRTLVAKTVDREVEVTCLVRAAGQ